MLRTLRATDVYDVPVLSMLAALQVAANVLLPDEAAFLLDALPARIMDTFVPAWRACCAGQRVHWRPRAAAHGGPAVARPCDELERGAAKEAVARMTATKCSSRKCGPIRCWPRMLAAAGKAAFFTDTASLARVHDRPPRWPGPPADSARMQRGGV